MGINLYAITAGNKENGFYRLDTSKNLNEQISTYYHMVSTPGILESKLISASAELYAQLLEPMLDDFQHNVFLAKRFKSFMLSVYWLFHNFISFSYPEISGYRSSYLLNYLLKIYESNHIVFLR